MTLDYSSEISKQLNEALTEKIVRHRERFSEIFKARYMELLPGLINYRNANTISVDFRKVEVALRNGYDIAIGQNVRGDIEVIGYVASKKTSENPADLFTSDILRHGDIHFTMPKFLRLKHYKEISHDDGCKSGNFTVLRNKNLNYISDMEIIDHYIRELSEIVLSRYSISMQVKITTLFIGEVGDETLNQIISDIYNGNPYVKASKLFDPQDQIYHMQNEGIAQNFQELKREYQNKISELNNMIGINSLAVEKESGVSDQEAQSNRGYTTSNANIYLSARNHGLDKLNKRFDLDIEARYNDDVQSEFNGLIKDGEQDDNSDPVQGDTIGTV